jgi:hypothetical protein
MGQKSLPTPVVAGIIAVVVILVVVFLYKGVTGGQVTEGKPGSIQASPPMPESAKQQMMQQMQKH